MFYKIVAKVLALRLKPILSEEITKENFRFFFQRQIDDVISIAQDFMRSVKLTNKLETILKLGLSKPYESYKFDFLKVSPDNNGNAHILYKLDYGTHRIHLVHRSDQCLPF
jgi:hypothetical protein